MVYSVRKQVEKGGRKMYVSGCPTKCLLQSSTTNIARNGERGRGTLDRFDLFSSRIIDRGASLLVICSQDSTFQVKYPRRKQIKGLFSLGKIYHYDAKLQGVVYTSIRQRHIRGTKWPESKLRAPGRKKGNLH